MSRTLPLFIGIALLAAAGTANAQTSLYDRMLFITANEQGFLNAEPPVEEFLPKIYDVKQDMINPAIRNEVETLCTEQNKPAWVGSCAEYREYIISLLQKQAWLRATVRDLQIAATRNEKGAHIDPGKLDSIIARIASITNIWQGGKVTNPDSQDALPIRSGAWNDTMTVRATELASLLNALITESGGEKDMETLEGAVWRYHYGLPFEDGACNAARTGLGDGTPLQYLSARWCTIETKLQAILDAVPANDKFPEVLFPSKVLLEDEGVEVWARGDNVGLRWQMHVNPVLPSLDCSTSASYAKTQPYCNTTKNSILGGVYPDPIPDPDPNTGLCGDPLAKRGYLCRPVDEAQCPADENDAIGLVRCAKVTMDQPTRWTIAGPDICMERPWIWPEDGEFAGDTSELDPLLEKGDCSNCVVDLYCRGDCGAAGFTHEKDDEGKIAICISDSEGAGTRYVIMHELIHAAQSCSGPPGGSETLYGVAQSLPGCCALEYPASMAACTAMDEDGLLDALGYTIEVCAAAFTNLYCASKGECAELEEPLTSEGVYDDLRESWEERAAELKLPTTCEEAVNALDPRAEQMKASMKQVCTPECKTQTLNTIEGNACVVGRCMEESLEWERWVPGRMAFMSGDETSPWDSDALVDASHQSFFAPLPSAKAPIPPYWPRWLVQEIDLAICQPTGHAEYATPSSCDFDPQRATKLRPSNPGVFVRNLEDQKDQAERPRMAVQSLAPGIAARIGARLFGDYLEVSLRPLTEAVQSANSMLRLLAEASFPTTMCTRNDVSSPMP